MHGTIGGAHLCGVTRTYSRRRGTSGTPHVWVRCTHHPALDTAHVCVDELRLGDEDNVKLDLAAILAALAQVFRLLASLQIGNSWPSLLRLDQA